jgi:hypothetical protein
VKWAFYSSSGHRADREESFVIIVCRNAAAAAKVATLLVAARLVPAHHFRVEPVFDRGEPITFTPRYPLPDPLLYQIAEVPEAQIIYPA